MNKSHLIGALCAVVFSLISLSSHAALLGRDLDGNLSTAEAYYDTVLGITWLGDANYAGTSMTWSAADTWVANLNPYGSGITGWRLPTVTDTGTSGCNFAFTGTDCGWNVDTSTGEMAHMFYVTLGNLGYFDTSGNPQTGWGLNNTGPFTNVQPSYYWSATGYAPNTGNAWGFDFSIGYQDYLTKGSSVYAWAVHSGDVGAAVVPVPAAVWLFGSGLLALVGIGKQRRR